MGRGRMRRAILWEEAAKGGGGAHMGPPAILAGVSKEVQRGGGADHPAAVKFVE